MSFRRALVHNLIVSKKQRKCKALARMRIFGESPYTHQVDNLGLLNIVGFPGALKLTWLVLGEDPAARSHRVEQFTAL
jgi:hypothetical protein